MLSASSDIGAHLARHYLESGSEVVGTYRTHTPTVDALEKSGVKLYRLDINSREQVRGFAKELNESGFNWDLFISATGVMDPIGGFFASDFEEWEQCFITNSTAQLRVLHATYGFRNMKNPSNVIFFAGGGTNGAFDNFSAYCAGKLSLIKMTELLHSEYADIKISIIGTGWVNTKFHLQTLAAGAAAGQSFEMTQTFLNGGKDTGTTLEAISECVDWCLSSPRSAVGGRNIALAHDPWKSAALIDQLSADQNLYKLRRYS